jgi:hypothetical protein
MVASAFSTLDTLGRYARQALVPRAGMSRETVPDLQLWADLYDGVAFAPDDLRYDALRRKHRLPPTFRLIHNPAGRVVEFYVGWLFRGGWHMDGRKAASGRPNLIPFAAETFEEGTETIAPAVMQGLTWAGGPDHVDLLTSAGTRLGSVLWEVMEQPADPETGQAGYVFPHVTQALDVLELDLSPAGNVRRYVIGGPEYRVRHPRTGEPVPYRKEVDREAVRVWYGEQNQPDQETSHGLGFCPAVWVKHFNRHGIWGDPPIRQALPKMLELNYILSRTDDWIDAFARQPRYIAGAKGLAGASSSADGVVRFADETGRPGDRDGTLELMFGPAGSQPHPILGNLPVGEIANQRDYLDGLIAGDVPEIIVWRELRAQNAVTGPGALAMVGDCRARYDQAQRNYHGAIVQMGQMLCAVGGHRIATSSWGRPSRLTPAQRRFAPFDLRSYARGELDFALDPLPLLEQSILDTIAEARAREQLQQPESLRLIGYSDEDIYGPDNVPDPRPGLLAERETTRLGQATAFGGLFDQGIVP